MMVALGSGRANTTFHLLRSHEGQTIDTYFLVFILVVIILVLVKHKCNQNCQSEQFDSPDYQTIIDFFYVSIKMFIERLPNTQVCSKQRRQNDN